METFHSLRYVQPFLPDRVQVDDDRVVLTKRSWFGLKSSTEQVRYDRVASVRVNRGMLWAELVVETAGGSAKDLSVSHLRKRDAAYIAERIREARTV